MISLRTIAHAAPAVAVGIAALLLPLPALAHDFGKDNVFFDRFIEGAGVVFNDVPLVLAAIAFGMLVSLWHQRGFPRTVGFLVAGIVTGFLMPMEWIARPDLFSLSAAILLGLLAAAAFLTKPVFVNLLAFLTGLALAAGTLGGHAPGTVPTGAYFGIVFGLILVTSIAATGSAMAVDGARSQIPRIAIRALASWVVAISVMMLALLFRQTAA